MDAKLTDTRTRKTERRRGSRTSVTSLTLIRAVLAPVLRRGRRKASAYRRSLALALELLNRRKPADACRKEAVERVDDGGCSGC
jgi:hypothetical protein